MMPYRRLVVSVALVLSAACALRVGSTTGPALDLGRAVHVADGVQLYHLVDPALLEPPGPISVHLLRVDTRRARLRSALARDQVMGLEAVEATAARHGAVAAVNAGFFRPSGDPDGVLKIDGELVSDRDPTRPRGAVAIVERASGRPQRLEFDQLSVTTSLSFEARDQRHTVSIAGIDTTRLRGSLMLFTPRYHDDTDTAPAGTEWTLEGTPFTVRGRSQGVGKTAIPRNGAVLSFGGTDPPAPLDLLTVGRVVEIERRYEAVFGTPQDTWERAHQIVGGAGLLVRDGRSLRDWDVERFRGGFTTERHPRTMIGVDDDGIVWLITVDGRQLDSSVGMTFTELQGLALQLGLEHALNLDGGGSTTMVVGERLVNSPSDVAGPRAVSDVLLVVAR